MEQRWRTAVGHESRSRLGESMLMPISFLTLGTTTFAPVAQGIPEFSSKLDLVDAKMGKVVLNNSSLSIMQMPLTMLSVHAFKFKYISRSQRLRVLHYSLKRDKRLQRLNHV